MKGKCECSTPKRKGSSVAEISLEVLCQIEIWDGGGDPWSLLEEFKRKMRIEASIELLIVALCHVYQS